MTFALWVLTSAGQRPVSRFQHVWGIVICARQETFRLVQKDPPLPASQFVEELHRSCAQNLCPAPTYSRRPSIWRSSFSGSGQLACPSTSPSYPGAPAPMCLTLGARPKTVCYLQMYRLTVVLHSTDRDVHRRLSAVHAGSSDACVADFSGSVAISSQPHGASRGLAGRSSASS